MIEFGLTYQEIEDIVTETFRKEADTSSTTDPVLITRICITALRDATIKAIVENNCRITDQLRDELEKITELIE